MFLRSQLSGTQNRKEEEQQEIARSFQGSLNRYFVRHENVVEHPIEELVDNINVYDFVENTKNPMEELVDDFIGNTEKPCNDEDSVHENLENHSDDKFSFKYFQSRSLGWFRFKNRETGMNFPKDKVGVGI